MKYTVEQLSRILSVAAVGELGDAWEIYSPGNTLCIEQCALADMDSSPACGNDRRMNAWDDEASHPSRPVPVLRWLEGKGFA